MSANEKNDVRVRHISKEKHEPATTHVSKSERRAAERQQRKKKKVLWMMVGVMSVIIVVLGLFMWHPAANDDYFFADKDEVVQDYPKYPEYPDYDASKYVTLGDYRSIKLDVSNINVAEPSDEEIRAFMAEKMSYVVDDSDDVMSALGDQVNIDFVGTVNGQTIKHGSGKNYDLVLGSNKMIDSFEKALVGLKAGEKKVFRISFPDNYKNQQVKGKTAEFSVVVNSIAHKGDVTDENIRLLTKNRLITIEEMYKESAEQLMQNNRMQSQDSVKSQLYSEIRKVCTVKEVPQDLIDWYVDSMLSTYKYKAMSYGMTLEQYLDADISLSRNAGREISDEESLKAYFAESGIPALENELIMHAIAQKEGITISDEYYAENVALFAKRYGFRNEQIFETAYQKSGILNQMLLDQTVDFLIQNAGK